MENAEGFHLLFSQNVHGGGGGVLVLACPDVLSPKMLNIF
jgi:hypothetical protein